MKIGFTFNDYWIDADIDECTDAYGTGDSPTLYDIELLKIINDDGDVIHESDMGKFFYNDVIEAAIEIYRDMR